MTTLCNRCSAPGVCCKDFALTTLFSVEPHPHVSTVEQYLKDEKLPFVATSVETELRDDTGVLWRTYHFNCPKLGDNGRCMIHRRRPQICRDYKAGSDELCVMFKDDGKLEVT